MSESTSITPSHRSVYISEGDWGSLKDQARMFLAAGCLPAAIKGPEQAMVVMLKGRELGIPPMASLSSIFLIKGTPTISAQLMLALCRRDLPGFRHGETETTDLIARVWVQRPGEERAEYSFTIEDARDAQLLGRPDSNWSKYPKRMLLHRAYSFACRTVCPEIILGCYTPEEAEEFEPRDVTPEPAKKTKFLPGIEPRATAEDYVARISRLPGGQDVIREQIVRYRKGGNDADADAIVEALDALEPDAPQVTLPEDEKLPFEKEAANGTGNKK